MTIAFPEGFIWGTATAAHQVGGGVFSGAVLEHYRRMLGCCREHGLTPIVTFHHFTSPRWFVASGGWLEAEGAASFAASAYAKLTGRPAACLSIAGPGATNLLTGLWDARMDRAPVLALTGQVDTQVLGPGAFQEVDLAAAFSSVAAWSQTVLPTSNHAELMTLALKNAVLQRNVVHLIFPNEVQTLPVEAEIEASGPEGRLAALDITPAEESTGHALELLLHGVAGRAGGPWENRRQEIAERWKLWRAEKETRIAEARGKGISSAAVFAAMSRQVPEEAVITVEVGNNTYSFGHYFECKRQALLMSGYPGSIGFGYPAALGAWAAAPERPVVTVTGDGGFAQYMGELCTAVKYGMRITHVLLNNSELGKISKEQRQGQFPVWATSLHNPDFSSYAEICGALGVRVSEVEELDAALESALAHDRPALVEVLTDPELV